MTTIEIEDLVNENERPGMPLVGFFAGAIISVPLWGVIGLIAYAVCRVF